MPLCSEARIMRDWPVVLCAYLDARTIDEGWLTTDGAGALVDFLLKLCISFFIVGL